ELPAPAFCCRGCRYTARRDLRTAQECRRIRRGRCDQPTIICASCRDGGIICPIRFRHTCTTTGHGGISTLRYAPGAVVHSSVLFPGARVCISARQVERPCGPEWEREGGSMSDHRAYRDYNYDLG